MLPQGFTRVEYIESTGTQYIDTGFKPNQDTRVIIDYQITTAQTIPLFGARNGSTNREFEMFAYADNRGMQDGYGSSQDYVTSSPNLNRTTIDKNKNITTSSDGSVNKTHAAQTFQCSYNMYLFQMNNGGQIYNASYGSKCYSCQIYDNGTLIRDYIPCIDENGDANLWDDVNETLAEKVGTFLYGAPVVPESLSGLVQINAQAGAAFLWNPSEDANKYVIARDGVKIATVYGNVTSYTDTGAIGEHTYTVTPYNGIQAGAEASITILTKIDTPVNLSASLDDRTVTLTWNAVIGAEGYRVYRDGAVVASVTSTSYIDTLNPPASVAYAVSAYAGPIQSKISQIVVVENWEGVLLTLITARTAADVAEAKRLRDKIFAGEALTDEEFARYNAGLRGCYNASDMNRVGAAVRYVAGRLNAEGYGAYVSPKTDWQMEDTVRQSDWNKYLDEVRHLRRKLTLMRTTPQITDGMHSGLKSYAEANAIEQILVDLDWMLTNIIRGYIYAGEVFAGEV